MEFFIGDKVRSPSLGEGVVAIVDGIAPYLTLTIDFESFGRRVVEPRQVGLELMDRGEQGRREESHRAEERALAHPVRSDSDLESSLRRVLREELGIGDIELGSRWVGGEMVLNPGKAGLQPKSIPIDGLFHKLVMVRERLRVLEQRINNHPKLDDADRLELQGYLTKLAGTLTTFNMLFAERDDWFVGATAEAPRDRS